jgi:hypothetical protein
MKHIPFLAIIVIAYNVLAFSAGTVLSKPIWGMQLVSGAQWSFTVSDLLLCAAVVLLYIELFKATRTSTASIFDHILSLVLFVVCLVEFLLIGPFGNSVFLVITLITLLDVVAGFTITISTARRDFGVGSHAGI